MLQSRKHHVDGSCGQIAEVWRKLPSEDPGIGNPGHEMRFGDLLTPTWVRYREDKPFVFNKPLNILFAFSATFTVYPWLCSMIT